VSSQRLSRSIVYRAEFGRRAVVLFILKDCCDG
jgi:hypothetical protein